MKQLWLALLLCLGLAPAQAQPVTGPAPVGPAGAYNSGTITCTTGQFCFLQTDVNGNLKTVASGTAPISGTVTAVPSKSTAAYQAVTVGTAESTILTSGGAQVFLDLVNLSPTATVCINFGATATITGTQCTAGEITLPPLWHRSWEGSFVPTDAVHAISSAAATPFTIGDR